ncbi:MAG: hypothetical protein E7035_08415 [Verrucomicrobiaceae bacterium]|nr:hypothetical protein [Verrucomicrobiaceae bacterium]
MNKEEKSIPNLFSYATSELSQDAFFAWLMQWADSSYKELDESLHVVAQNFIRLLLDDNNFETKKISIKKQWKNIDILAEINDDTILIIEDKTDTSVHDKQLERYKNTVEKEYKGKNIKCAYIKIINEPNLVKKNIESKERYKYISRRDLIDCLNTYKGENQILKDYLEHISKIEEATQVYKTKPISEWGNDGWKGFYKALEDAVNDEEPKWEYVPNGTGGFLGFWWYFRKIPEGKIYLQFEEKDDLRIKVYHADPISTHQDFRKKVCNIIEKKLGDIKPDRLGTGVTMTVAVIRDIDIKSKLINLKDFIEKYEKIVDDIASELNKNVIAS